jgi:lipoprotein-releasing system permease protein
LSEAASRNRRFPASAMPSSAPPSAEIDLVETAAVVIMALTLSFLATLYPSWCAARLDPVEALRQGG